MDSELVHELHALIAVAEACWHRDSHSWHVFDWMAWKLRCKYPLVRRESIINMDITS